MTPPDPTHLDALARQVAALLAGVLVAFGCSVVLGEYEITGATPFMAGAVVGFLVAEVIVSVASSRTRVAAGVGAVSSGLAIWWAARISSGHGVSPFPAIAWAGVALAVVVAWWRLRPVR